MPEGSDLRRQSQEVGLDDVKAVFNMAKIGLHKAPWRVAPKYAASYRKIKQLLEATGRLPK